MRLEAKKLLFDMRRASELVLRFTHGKSLQDYESDQLLRSAVERQFQIVGEALYQLDEMFPDVAHRITSWKDIIRFRHVLVHGYDKIDDDTVWGIIKGDLATLQSDLDAMLAEPDEP